MPTTNPRINVTLSPSTDALVRRLATFQRVSKSQVLRELLIAAEPALQRVAALMEAAEGAQKGVLQGLATGLEKAQGKAELDLAEQLRAVESMTADLVDLAEQVRGRRPARASALVGARAGRSGARNPPPSNRGVKSTRTGKARATKGGKK